MTPPFPGGQSVVKDELHVANPKVAPAAPALRGLRECPRLFARSGSYQPARVRVVQQQRLRLAPCPGAKGAVQQRAAAVARSHGLGPSLLARSAPWRVAERHLGFVDEGKHSGCPGGVFVAVWAAVPLVEHLADAPGESLGENHVGVDGQLGRQVLVCSRSPRIPEEEVLEGEAVQLRWQHVVLAAVHWEGEVHESAWLVLLLREPGPVSEGPIPEVLWRAEHWET
mmetsp:Transcript_50783/g.134859  ORF Transcript_50783/g.134859 Transcript_50783/m.134859 type:complete len:226 (-) Transcript_50783:1168-1845(-)